MTLRKYHSQDGTISNEMLARFRNCSISVRFYDIHKSICFTQNILRWLRICRTRVRTYSNATTISLELNLSMFESTCNVLEPVANCEDTLLVICTTINGLFPCLGLFYSYLATEKTTIDDRQAGALTIVKPSGYQL